MNQTVSDQEHWLLSLATRRSGLGNLEEGANADGHVARMPIIHYSQGASPVSVPELLRERIQFQVSTQLDLFPWSCEMRS